MKVGDLVLLEPTNTWAEKEEIKGGPALVLATDGCEPAGLLILPRNQKQVWVSMNEVEVINEYR